MTMKKFTLYASSTELTAYTVPAGKRAKISLVFFKGDGQNIGNSRYFKIGSNTYSPITSNSANRFHPAPLAPNDTGGYIFTNENVFGCQQESLIFNWTVVNYIPTHHFLLENETVKVRYGTIEFIVFEEDN